MLGALAGCLPAPGPALPPPTPAPTLPAPDMTVAARNFIAVVEDVAPVIEQVCREADPGLDCAFRIVIDDRPGLAPNAFHTLDPRTGQPLIGFTLALIAEARNRDELAFVMGHEAGHHIAGHIPRAQNNALTGAMILGTITALGGGDAGMIRTAQDIGAGVGGRRFSKDYELEADMLGTLIAWRAGYDPERGAGFFDRLPDPGNRFLGTHPPNAQRIATVRQTLVQLRAGQRR